MTDEDIMRASLRAIDPSCGKLRLIRRNGRPLLALPPSAGPALRALSLYQPQRGAARTMIRLLRISIRFGIGTAFLPLWKPEARPSLESDWPRAVPGTCGILLGSQEHRTKRVIASYLNNGAWEVAKIFFGKEGRQILEQEAELLGILAGQGAGTPPLLGFHHAQDMTILRMPYLDGSPVPPGESDDAVRLLDSWIRDSAARRTDSFPEWSSIRSAIEHISSAAEPARILSSFRLRPVIRHGDFARWNLRKAQDGSLVVLDWEWGDREGMPGIDLVHYFLQDARLVSRMSPQAAVKSAIAGLSAAGCRDYLEKTGWGANPVPPIVACLAFKQGAGHQENTDALMAALGML